MIVYTPYVKKIIRRLYKRKDILRALRRFKVRWVEVKARLYGITGGNFVMEVVTKPAETVDIESAWTDLMEFRKKQAVFVIERMEKAFWGIGVPNGVSL